MNPTRFLEFRAEWPEESQLAEILASWKFDKQKYVNNLLDVGEVLDANGVPFMLAFGTLLGAIRDNGPCEGDQDVDVMVLEDQEPKLVKLFLEDFAMEHSFKLKGFRICRVSENMLTVDRDNSYVDIYIFRKMPDLEPNLMYGCCDYRIDGWRVLNPWTMPLHGRQWKIPSRPESYLTEKYGHWRVPQDYHAKT